MSKIQFAECFKPLLSGEYENIILECGRVGGKSKHMYLTAGVRIAAYPEEDIVICRASYGSIGDSSFNEMLEVLNDIEEFDGKFVARSSPYRLSRADGGGTIYFMGIGGSKDRTKGFKPKHKVGMVIIEEAQELKSQEHLDQTLATLRRRFGEHCLLVVAFNPPNNVYHWINKWSKIMAKDKDWLIIHNSWQDILPFLNDRDVKEILKTKFIDNDYYNYMYMGIPTGGLGRVYPMFREDLHVVKYESRQTSKIIQDFRVVACIVGCDGAVTHDKTVFVPRLIMSNGQAVAAQIFMHDPKINGVKGSFPLVENEGTRWFADLRRENELDNPYDYRYSIPIIFVVDSAATELIQALNYYFGNRALVRAIKKGTILQMVDVVQSAIGKNVVSIYDYGGYYNYTQNRFIQCPNPLVEEYVSLLWNEKQTGYDNSIPNDCTDADTYGINFYYKNTENLVWLDDVANRRKDYYTLKKE